MHGGNDPEDDYGMIDWIINNRRRGEELKKDLGEARRITLEKSLDGWVMSQSKKWSLEWAFFLGENGRRQYNKLCQGYVHPLQ